MAIYCFEEVKLYTLDLGDIFYYNRHKYQICSYDFNNNTKDNFHCRLLNQETDEKSE